jgi:hypothetical protein
MKRIANIVFLISFLGLGNCSEEKSANEIAKDNLIFYLLSYPEFIRPSNCSRPEILLEEGEIYNITLEEGKRFWFDYAVRSQGISSKRYRLTINKNEGIDVQYQLKDCHVSNEQGVRKIIESSPTQIVYENESFSYDGNKDSPNTNYRFFLNSTNVNTNVSIFFNQL